MLNKDEELRLASFIDSLKDDVQKEREEADLTPRALLWLAEKLKETNDQLKKISTNLDELMTKEWGKHWERNKEEDDKESKLIEQQDYEEPVSNAPEVYKHPKNEISDRFYPR